MVEPSPRFAGALAGLLAGEAFGMPYEQESAEAIPADPAWTGGGLHGRPAGTFGEAGGLCLATADSLLRCQDLDPDDLARAWIAWWAEGTFASGGSAFDAGPATVMALEALAQGVDPRKTGLAGEDARGPGALLRVLPAAWLPPGLGDAAAVEQAVRMARITHRHPEVLAAAGLLALLVRRLGLEATPAAALGGALEDLPVLLTGPEGDEASAAAARLPEAAEWRDPGPSGYVYDLLGSAWHALAAGRNFRDTVKRAVSLGGRCASRSALAGALAGARWGLGAVPEAWIRRLRLDPAGKRLLTRLRLVPAAF